MVGKIIIDRYGKPDDDDPKISIGGGGPQAAFGAAAALALLSSDSDNNNDTKQKSIDHPPCKQPITFVAPVGDLDWTEEDDRGLADLLGDAVDSIHLIRGESLHTPRIQLWHNEDQTIEWHPLNDSFGPTGAQGLWDNRPSANDVVKILSESSSSSGEKIETNIACHAIVEGVVSSGGKDVRFLREMITGDENPFTCVGIEPVTFPDDETGKVPDTDFCRNLIHDLRPTIVSPDQALYSSINDDDSAFWNQYDYDVAIRKGPQGSVVKTHNGREEVSIPAASLMLSTTSKINPTGAGNAYAAAYTACRSLGGLSAVDAATYASCIGAVFCEYDHMPPWTAEVFDRMREARQEIVSELVRTTALLDDDDDDLS